MNTYSHLTFILQGLLFVSDLETGDGGKHNAVYANMQQMQQSADNQTYAQYRAKLRPTGGIYSQFSPGKYNTQTSLLHATSHSYSSSCDISSSC